LTLLLCIHTYIDNKRQRQGPAAFGNSLLSRVALL
jgi:hypothetical protein